MISGYMRNDIIFDSFDAENEIQWDILLDNMAAIEFDSDIVLDYSLGLWNGTQNGFCVADGVRNLADLVQDLMSGCGSYGEFTVWKDRYNLYIDIAHHDGCNTYKVLKIRKGKDVDNLIWKMTLGDIYKNTLTYYCQSVLADVLRQW